MSGAAPSAPSPPLPTTHPLLLLARDIKLAHSVFALPFALLGACLALAMSGALHAPVPMLLASQIGLVVLCMIFARTWAMLVNRLVDRAFDQRNPRTQRRALASGAVASQTGWRVAAASALGFALCCGLFGLLPTPNWWPLVLCLPVLAWIAFYSYTKRFTALCHLVLGTALAAAPLCAAIALHPPALHNPALWAIAGFVLCWVAGFDIIYALQDQDFDRRQGLSSIPAALGWRGALWLSRALHVCALVLLILSWRTSQSLLREVFLAGIVLTAGLLVWEHIILARLEAAALRPRPDGSDNPPPALNMAFFTLNGVISCVLGGAGLIDILRP